MTNLFTNSSGTAVSLGAALRVCCDFTGPGVEWFFNALPFNGNITLVNKGRSEVEISSFSYDHAGTYQCVTGNEYQTVYRSLTLTATGKTSMYGSEDDIIP